MRHRFIWRNFALLILLIFTLACSFASNLVTTPTPLPTETPTITFTPTITSTPTITPTPTITFTPTPFYEVGTIGILSFPAGGFTIPDLNTFDVDPQTASLFYINADETVRVSIYSYISYNGYDPLTIVRNAAEKMNDDFDDMVTSEPATESLADYSLTFMDFHGAQYDEVATGRFAVLAPPNSKLISIYVVAYGDQRWEREGIKAYQTLLDGIAITSIAIADECRVAASSGYGSLPDAYIPIGGELRQGEQRIVNYLDALLGPNGEFVAYHREGVQAYGSINLEKYSIRYGETTQFLYFDIYSSSDLSVPGGMHCSAPLPERIRQ